MTDNPTLSPQRQPEDTDAAQQLGTTHPSAWLGFVALLAAPLAAAIISESFFNIGVRLAGHRPEPPSLGGLGFAYSAFALVFIPLGGALMMMFWWRAPFGPLLSSTFGAIGGVLVALVGIGIQSLDGEQFDIGATSVLGLGAVGGLAAGLTIWLICRLGSRARHD